MRPQGIAPGLALIVLLSSSTANTMATEIALRLHTDRQQYRIGDRITFTIVFKNVSTRPLWLLPQSETCGVDALLVKPVKGHGAVEKIRFGLPSFAWDELSREVVKLEPQQRVARHLVAEIESRLPPDYGDQRRGLYLIVPASALRLPQFVPYEVRAVFHSSANHPVNAYLPPTKKLWTGDVLSEPVIIDIAE